MKEHSYWVEPNKFLAGEHPGSSDPQLARENLRSLLAVGIEVFVDLTHPAEFYPYDDLLTEEANYPVEYHRRSIEDRGVPTVAEMQITLAIIETALAKNQKVYVHCVAGIGRTGTVVGCYLAAHGHDALEKLWQLRAGTPDAAFTSPETAAQRDMVQTWRLLTM